MINGGGGRLEHLFSKLRNNFIGKYGYSMIFKFNIVVQALKYSKKLGMGPDNKVLPNKEYKLPNKDISRTTGAMRNPISGIN